MNASKPKLFDVSQQQQEKLIYSTNGLHDLIVMGRMDLSRCSSLTKQKGPLLSTGSLH